MRWFFIIFKMKNLNSAPVRSHELTATKRRMDAVADFKMKK